MHWLMAACHIDLPRDSKRRRCHGQDDILILEPFNANRNSPALLSSIRRLKCSNASERDDHATACGTRRCTGGPDFLVYRSCDIEPIRESAESATEFAGNLSRYLVIHGTRSIKIAPLLRRGLEWFVFGRGRTFLC